MALRRHKSIDAARSALLWCSASIHENLDGCNHRAAHGDAEWRLPYRVEWAFVDTINLMSVRAHKSKRRSSQADGNRH